MHQMMRCYRELFCSGDVRATAPYRERAQIIRKGRNEKDKTTRNT